MRLSVLLAALLFTSACTARNPLAPMDGPLRFSGTVLATDGVRVGVPIAGAELRVVSGVNASAQVTSDAGGHYVFDGLESGRFTVAITAPGYVTANPVVALYRNTEANFALLPR